MKLLELVKDYEIITIFRHQAADSDALGSQFGLLTYLKEHYPEKQIYAIGNDVGSSAYLFPQIDQVEDAVIENSIAFVLDTSNVDRVDDQRFLKAKKIIKIDHHIILEQYGDENYVDTKASAVCEILTFMMHEESTISKQTATYLYYGLLADSLSFTTNNTTSNTLLAASYLVEAGVDVTKVRNETSGMSVNHFYYMNAVRNRVKVYGKVAYSIMPKSIMDEYGLSYNEAKEKVFALADVNEFEIWCLFSEDVSYGSNLFNGSLRSRNVAINKVANKYNGGGHANACGVKKLTLDDIMSLVKDLNAL